MSTKNYLVEIFTNWCGEDHTYSAICDDGHMDELEGIANLTSYDNFVDFDGFDGMMNELFPNHDSDEDWDDDELGEGYNQEAEYYGYRIDEYEGSDEDWNDYDLLYDSSSE